LRLCAVKSYKSDRVLAGFLVSVIAVLCFVACPSSNKGISIGVAIYKFDDTFMASVRDVIELNAVGKARLEVVNSQNAQSVQNDQVAAFLSKNLKAIAINPVDRSVTATIIEKAMGKKIPVVFFNREPLPEDMAKWDKVFYVGAKAEESGIMQGEIAYDYWTSHPDCDKNGDGKLQYIMLKGEPEHQDAELRTQFAIQYLKERNVKVECLAEDYAMWDKPRAVEKMDAFWAKFGGNIEMVFCNNDDMALGVIETLKKYGFFQNGKYLPVLGVDATAPALAALEEGTLLGTVLNDAENQGKAAFEIAYALATGTNPNSTGWTITDGKYIWIPYQKVTRGNYQQFKK